MKAFLSVITLLSALSPLSQARPTPPKTLEGGWVLDWHDEFNGSRLDQKKWKYDTGLSNRGTAHCYTEDAISVRGGKLIITSRHQDTPNPNYNPEGKTWQTTTKVQPYSSGAVMTRGTKDFLYGRVEVRAKFDDVTGIWPAIWLFADVPGNKWASPKCGEIDILEHVSQDAGLVQTAFHWGENGTLKLKSAHYTRQMDKKDFFNKFHTYTLEWNEGGGKIYVDGIHFGTFDSDLANYPNGEANPFRRPQYLILNTAIGGAKTWPEQANPKEYPTDFVIDYVRYYVQADAPEKATLRYAYNFNQSDKKSYQLTLGGNQAAYKGSSTLTRLRGKQWLSASFPGMAASASAHPIHSGTVGFIGADALHMSFEDGFTIASNFKYSGTATAEQDTLASFKIQEQSYTISYSKNKKGLILTTKAGNSVTSSEAIAFPSLVDTKEAWYTFILSGQTNDDKSTLTLSVYSTGKKPQHLGSTTLDGFTPSDLLGDFAYSNAATPDLGSVTKDAKAAPLLGYIVDNLAIYEGHATPTEWQRIASALAKGKIIQRARAQARKK